MNPDSIRQLLARQPFEPTIELLIIVVFAGSSRGRPGVGGTDDPTGPDRRGEATRACPRGPR